VKAQESDVFWQTWRVFVAAPVSAKEKQANSEEQECALLMQQEFSFFLFFFACSLQSTTNQPDNSGLASWGPENREWGHCVRHSRDGRA